MASFWFVRGISMAALFGLGQAFTSSPSTSLLAGGMGVHKNRVASAASGISMALQGGSKV
jgi:hypothetical protein